jgi:phosphoserine phosphatase RsbU/P
LRTGDRLVLFTDGVTEACNSQDEEFGEDRLLSVLQENRSASATEIQKSILHSVSEFSHAPWRDDATLLVVAVA